jgi:hypothetical protein
MTGAFSRQSGSRGFSSAGNEGPPSSPNSFEARASAVQSPYFAPICSPGAKRQTSVSGAVGCFQTRSRLRAGRRPSDGRVHRPPPLGRARCIGDGAATRRRGRVARAVRREQRGPGQNVVVSRLLWAPNRRVGARHHVGAIGRIPSSGWQRPRPNRANRNRKGRRPPTTSDERRSLGGAQHALSD